MPEFQNNSVLFFSPLRCVAFPKLLPYRHDLPYHQSDNSRHLQSDRNHQTVYNVIGRAIIKNSMEKRTMDGWAGGERRERER